MNSFIHAKLDFSIFIFQFNFFNAFDWHSRLSQERDETKYVSLSRQSFYADARVW